MNHNVTEEPQTYRKNQQEEAKDHKKIKIKVNVFSSLGEPVHKFTINPFSQLQNVNSNPHLNQTQHLKQPLSATIEQ